MALKVSDGVGAEVVEGAGDTAFGDLDVRLVEQLDPGNLINMTDDGCGSTCEKTTCITAV